MTPNPNPSPELLGCPFCGGEATYQWHSSPECWIECQTCFAVGPNDKDTTTEQHVVGWNTRALSQTLPAPGEVQPHCTGCWVGVPNHECAKDSTLATVAAANDEAFARGVEAAAKVAEGPANAWGEFPGNTPERDRIAAAIRRLVLQGGAS